MVLVRGRPNRQVTRGSIPSGADPFRPAEFVLRARRRYGQHFLVRRDIARRIVALAELTGRESVLEIGPGRGALTGFLADVAAELWLVEIDRDLCALLGRQFGDRPQIHLVPRDILSVDLDELLPVSRPAVVVANLPYRISTPVLMKLIEKPERFRRLVLMLQREVAERLVAPPGSKAYGALSVMVQLVARVRVALAVSPASFRPRPKVESAVVVADPCFPPRRSAAELNGVRKVVRAVFTQRRKQLVNALAPLEKDARRVLERLSIDPRRRPETLTAEEFAAIARALGTLA